MMDFIQEVYDSLCGTLVDPLPEVEDAFEEGGFCDQKYAEMLEAYQRLCVRLGKRDTDEDVEIIIGAFFDIQRVLCEKMYYYGAKFGMQ